MLSENVYFISRFIYLTINPFQFNYWAIALYLFNNSYINFSKTVIEQGYVQYICSTRVLLKQYINIDKNTVHCHQFITAQI